MGNLDSLQKSFITSTTGIRERERSGVTERKRERGRTKEGPKLEGAFTVRERVRERARANMSAIGREIGVKTFVRSGEQRLKERERGGEGNNTLKPWSSLDKGESLACQITSTFYKNIGCFKAIFLILFSKITQLIV